MWPTLANGVGGLCDSLMLLWVLSGGGGGALSGTCGCCQGGGCVTHLCSCGCCQGGGGERVFGPLRHMWVQRGGRGYMSLSCTCECSQAWLKEGEGGGLCGWGRGVVTDVYDTA